MFLSDVQTINWLLFFIECRQLYCSFVRFVLGSILFDFMLLFRLFEKFVIAVSTSTGASGAFQFVGI